MPNHLSIFSFKQENPLAPFWLLIAAIILVETTLAFVPDNSLVKTFRSGVLPAKSPDWQIMGDSVAYGGIIATQLTTYLPTGQTAYNLATPGTGPEFPYFYLKREIDAGKSPKAIIYAPSPHTFSSLRVPLLVAAFCDWPEIQEVSLEGRETMDVFYGILCRFSYTLRHREQIAYLIKSGHRLTTSDGTVTLPNPNLKSQQRPRWTIENLDARYKKPFMTQPFNDAFFNKFLDLAASHKIPIYWVTMPVLPAVSECRKERNFESAYFHFIDSLERQGKIRTLQREFITWSEENFRDQSHLSSVGAEKFTRLMGEKLKALQVEPSTEPQSTNKK